MPYIKQNERNPFDPHIEKLIDILKQKPAWNSMGSVNYIITKIILSLWHNCRTYHMGNAIVGVLHCAASEFVRRHLSKLEDEKIRQNGDVYPWFEDCKETQKPVVIGARLRSIRTSKIYIVIDGYVTRKGHRKTVIKLAGIAEESLPPFSVAADCIRTYFEVLS